MSKRTIRNTSTGKTMGRSRGKLVNDPVIGDIVSAKIYNARKTNKPWKYKNIDNN